MATNTVEATLISRYVDQVSAGFQKTLNTMQAGMMAAASGVHAMATGMAESWANFGLQLLNTSRQGQSAMQQFSLGVAGIAVLVIGAVARMGASFINFFTSLASKSSEVLELKLAFESLTATMGVAGDKMLGDLKNGTEGLVSSTTLLRNANRILTADIPITSKQYTDLVANIFKLSKASGVDATQAINTLTDSLVRGNARGLQQLGLNMGQVKDAISQVAEATGVSTGKLENDAKLRTYYNELMRATGVAVQRNSADYFSLADAMQKSERVFNSWKDALGEAIGRSRVFEELLQRFSRSLDELGPKRDQVEAMAISVNHLIISALRMFAELLDIITAFGPLWASLYAGVKAIGSAVVDMLSLLLGIVTHFIGRFFELLSFIPRVGEMFKPLVRGLAELRDTFFGFSQKARESFDRSFEGFGSGVIKLEQLSASSRSLAEEMGRYANAVVKGEAGTRSHSTAAGEAAGNQQRLNDQLKAHQQLMREYAQGFSSVLGVYDEYFRKLKQIDADVVSSEQQWQNLRLALARETAAKLVEIEQEKNNKIAEDLLESMNLQRAIQDASSDVRTLKLPNQPPSEPQNLGTDPTHVALNNAELQRQQELQRIQEQVRRQQERNTPDWAKPLRDMHLEMEKLNQIPMGPFHQTFAAMRSSVLDFAGQAGQAFANFFSDLVSGQEGAGKKLLAAFIGMVGQMLVKNGVMLIQVGLAEMALASTLVGKMMGASHAAGAHAVAIGMIQAAIGGALVGVASSMAQTNTAGSAGTSFQQSVPRPIASTQTQVIQVGAAGRAQNSGDVPTSQPKDLGTLTIKLEKGLIVQEVKSNIQSNGVLRPVIQSI
jgi:hypothetical protein